MTPSRSRPATLAATAACLLLVSGCGSGSSGSSGSSGGSGGTTAGGTACTGPGGGGGGTASGSADQASASAGTGQVATGNPAVAATASAGRAFLATLSAAQRSAVTFAWSDQAAKACWSNFPTGAFHREGLKWGTLSTTQRAAWLAMMKASLSEQGYARIMGEFEADDALVKLEGDSNSGGGPEFGTQAFYVALIGAPSATGSWMYQFGGHHVTANVAITGGRVQATPSFIGAQPTTYKNAAGTQIKPLADIDAAAFRLVGSLDAQQRKAAVLGTTPIDLVLGPGKDGVALAPEGVPGAKLTSAQQADLLALIGHYTGLVDKTDAADRLAEVRAGLDETYFAWYGPTTSGAPAYFRVTGPSVVIEYAPQATDTSSGKATVDHIHGIYRNPLDEYGSQYAG